MTSIQKADTTALDDEQLLEFARLAADTLRAQVARRVVGQREALDLILVALFSNGHALSVGVPGLAKTLMISTVAEALALQFNRVQFTPDMMPSDITGSEVLEEDRTTGQRQHRFVRGPVFAQVLLADELNRTPPKTQAALLQAMQERHVSVAGRHFTLPAPFLVLATQNPIEQQGTYPLPEAQLDRFLLSIYMDYPSLEDEVEVVQRTTDERPSAVEAVVTTEQILAVQGLVRRVPVAEHLVRSAVQLVRASRPESPDCPDELRPLIRVGASPRGSQSLILAAKARAVMLGRPTVTLQDVHALADAVLAHRIVPSFRAISEGVDPRALVRLLTERCLRR